jgi:HAD superfamily hydrolase (TIGR01490 family)
MQGVSVESLMAEEKTILAIFDFDGTLTGGHLWSGIAKHHQTKQIKRRTVFWYLLSHMPYWLAAKVHLYSEEKSRAKWGEDMSVLFKGFTLKESQDMFEWVSDNYFLPLMKADVLARLKEHQQQKHKIMILSGMYSDFLKVIGQRLGVDYIVGTRLEKIKNIYSGRIIPPLCFGENKAKCLQDFLQESKLGVDLKSSYAYADSIYDLSVFNLVGNPVATYPEKELYQLARNKKWQIVGQPSL